MLDIFEEFRGLVVLLNHEWEGNKPTVVSPKGLITLKRLRGSGQDLDDIKALSGEELNDEIYMSSAAITTRLRRISQLRRLCLSLQKTTFSAAGNKSKVEERRDQATPEKSANKPK
ncbi:MAG: hypothetical protein H0U60_07745 [Blastocatellia bacterium]|nr:hypothetical protein [Blastocatellia bacterium]